MSSSEYFDDVASRWDEMRSGFYPANVRGAALAAGCVEPGMTAADIGGGTGFIIEGLGDRGLRVLGVEQSAAMLTEMEKKLSESGDLDCRVGEPSSLPIADAALDCAFANMYLHHVPVPGEAVKEMARTLKPGGRLVITDLDAHDFEFLREEHHDRRMGFERMDLERWFREAGVSGVSVKDVGESCSAESAFGTELASVSIFVALGVK